jgi:DNA repair protein RecN (Recombination protein N)
LAIQLSLPGDQLPETVIFDEVEAGLGGRAAVLAGYKLKELSSRSQVILITHEASIAALADQHYVVYKLNENTVIYEPPWNERISELARMLSGDYSLEEARQHAEKLLSENSLSTTGKN